MRYSSNKTAKFKQPIGPKRSNEAFFRAAWPELTADAPACALLLVGGNDFRGVALRQAQAVLRFDRRPSYFSHAAILLELDAKDPGRSRGVEVSLEPEEPDQHVPERNGVTPFRLARYFDAARYPNLGLCGLALGAEAGAALRSTALRPLRDLTRYPLWERLGSWARYVYARERAPNPLLEGQGIPSALWCEAVLEAADVPLTLSATDNNVCPELLWATLKHFQPELAHCVRIRSYQLIRDRTCAQPEPLSVDLEL
jgi:hypothetical protein